MRLKPTNNLKASITTKTATFTAWESDYKGR